MIALRPGCRNGASAGSIALNATRGEMPIASKYVSRIPFIVKNPAATLCSPTADSAYGP